MQICLDINDKCLTLWYVKLKMKEMKMFKAKHKSTGLYLRVSKDGEYTLSKNGSELSEIEYTQQLYDKKVALYCGKYTKLYESTYKVLSWSETWKPTRMFVWADLADFEIEDL